MPPRPRLRHPICTACPHRKGDHGTLSEITAAGAPCRLCSDCPGYTHPDRSTVEDASDG